MWLIRIQWNATAATMRKRPVNCNDSTWIILVFGLVLRGIQVHSPTATGLEKPTRANRVEE